MNLDVLLQKLFSAVRSQPPREEVPYAFEKRVMARVRALARVDPWAFWAHALWRAAAPCLAITLVLGGWFYIAPLPKATSADLSQEIDNTVLAEADAEVIAESLW
jgi:hypothetical protein